MFKWTENYQLFLFDFDGLLVDTERLHFFAYRTLCERRGFQFPWDFNQYCKVAHTAQANQGIKEALYGELPGLYKQEPSWGVLYGEKKKIYVELLERMPIYLMPGAEALLTKLAEENRKRVVVTHSLKEHVDLIKKRQPILSSIPNWITRDDYSNPKPHPECYAKAISLLGLPNDRVIGFEDTARGLKALQGARVTTVLICSAQHPQWSEISEKPSYHYESLEDLAHKAL